MNITRRGEGEFASIFVLVFVLGAIIFGVVRCNQPNNQAKNWGGTQTIQLPANTKLVNATWKDSEMWYLTRPMRKDEKPEEHVFHEQSNFGLLEGTIVFKESVTTVEK